MRLDSTGCLLRERMQLASTGYRAVRRERLERGSSLGEARICWLGRAAALFVLLLMGACQTPQSLARESGQRKLLQALRKPSNQERVASLYEAEQLFASAEDKEQQAMALQWIALTEIDAGRLASALASLRRSLVIYPGHPGFMSRMRSWWTIGDLELRLGRPERARVAFEHCWSQAHADQNLVEESQAVAGLARVHAARGNQREARSWFHNALVLAERSGSLPAIADSLQIWGEQEASLGHDEAARERFTQALAYHQEALLDWEARPDHPGFARNWESIRRRAAHVLFAATRLELSNNQTARAQSYLEEAAAMLLPLPMQSPVADDTESNRLMWQTLEVLRAQTKAASQSPSAADVAQAAVESPRLPRPVTRPLSQIVDTRDPSTAKSNSTETFPVHLLY